MPEPTSYPSLCGAVRTAGQGRWCTGCAQQIPRIPLDGEGLPIPKQSQSSFAAGLGRLWAFCFFLGIVNSGGNRLLFISSWLVLYSVFSSHKMLGLSKTSAVATIQSSNCALSTRMIRPLLKVVSLARTAVNSDSLTHRALVY